MTPGKRYWLVLALVLALAALVAVTWRRESPQIVTLLGGQYRFVGATHGTNHVQGTMAARLVHRLPTSVESFLRKRLGSRLGPYMSFPTTQPSLVVQFEQLGTNTNAPSLHFTTVYAVLANEIGELAGDVHPVAGPWAMPTPWPRAVFNLVPRRSREIECVLFISPTSPYQPREAGRVRFRNPLFGRFPEWQPEPLPSVKKSGDLEVTLVDFTTGSRNRERNVTVFNGEPTLFHRAAPGERTDVVFKLEFNSPRGANETWDMHSAALSDATGNQSRTRSRNYAFEKTGEYAFGPALWPGEAAWRLQLELKRKSGFLPEGIVTFRDVQLLPTNASNKLSITNTVEGVQIVLVQEIVLVQGAVAENSSLSSPMIRFVIQGKPGGYAIDYLRMTTGAGSPGNISRTPASQMNEFDVVMLRSVPADVKTVDITYTVQKTRTVEFFVKPPKAE